MMFEDIFQLLREKGGSLKEEFQAFVRSERIEGARFDLECAQEGSLYTIGVDFDPASEEGQEIIAQRQAVLEALEREYSQ